MSIINSNNSFKEIEFYFPSPDTTLDELLEQLGYSTWKILVTAFALPTFNICGIIICSISACVFFKRKFSQSVFFYYRLLSLVYIFHLIHNLLYSIFFSPYYFSRFNTYAIATYLVYCRFMSNLLFHFEDVLQIAILLTRWKKFNPFIEKHFTSSPKRISMMLFITCLLIDLPVLSAFKISSFGEYVYYDSGGFKKKAAFYYPTSSEFAKSFLGKLITSVSYFLLNTLLSMIVGVALNVISFIQFKNRFGEWRSHVDELEKQSVSFNSKTNKACIKLKSRVKINTHQAEKKMLYMIIIICSISIVSRGIFMIFHVYFIRNEIRSFSNFLVMQIASISIYCFGPTVSIFVYYSFNKMYRQALQNFLIRIGKKYQTKRAAFKKSQLLF